mmetsp:Transcript_31979/g.60143  ORF Transcript_31979/g.60143 Transcript_31979/m.60143 type:complete len:212 (-) Transcript_31979:319-954(-)
MSRLVQISHYLGHVVNWYARTEITRDFGRSQQGPIQIKAPPLSRLLGPIFTKLFHLQRRAQHVKVACTVHLDGLEGFALIQHDLDDTRRVELSSLRLVSIEHALNAIHQLLAVLEAVRSAVGPRRNHLFLLNIRDCVVSLPGHIRENGLIVWSFEAEHCAGIRGHGAEAGQDVDAVEGVPVDEHHRARHARRRQRLQAVHHRLRRTACLVL